MARNREQVVEVELVEDDGDPTADWKPVVPRPGDRLSAPSRRNRAPLRRWWPVALVAVSALLLVELNSGSTQAARWVAVRGAEGLVDPISTPLTLTEVSTADIFGYVAEFDGIRVATETDNNGFSVLGRDSSGEIQWRTTFPGRVDSDLFWASDCWSTGETVTCWFAFPENASKTSTVMAASTLIRLDPSTGTVVEKRTLPDNTTAGGDDQILLTADASAGTITVRAQEEDSGETRWETALSPLPHSTLVGIGRAYFFVNNNVATYSNGQWTWVVDLVTGTELAVGEYAWFDRAGTVILKAEGAAQLLQDDGRVVPAGGGEQVWRVADDGSAPSLIFLFDYESSPFHLRAAERDTGTERWSYPVDDWGAGSLLILGGLVVGSTDGRLVALDAATGTIRWEQTFSPDGAIASLASDGMHILVVAPTGDDGSELRRYDLFTGRLSDSLPLPERVTDVGSRDGVLYLFGGDRHYRLN